jgi:hypothetical protein
MKEPFSQSEIYKGYSNLIVAYRFLEILFIVFIIFYMVGYQRSEAEEKRVIDFSRLDRQYSLVDAKDGQGKSLPISGGVCLIHVDEVSDQVEELILLRKGNTDHFRLVR